MSDEIRELLQLQYAKLELELLECFNSYEQAPKKRLVHQMRVNLKKQLAFLILMQDIVPDEALAQHSAILQEFQKRLGKVRDCQVQCDKAEQIESDLVLANAISDNLKKIEKKDQDNWLKYKEQANLAGVMSSLRVLVAEGLEKTTPAALKEPILGQFRHILFEIKCWSNIASFNDDALHTLRIFLKRLIYFWNFLAPHFAGFPIETAFWDLVKRLEQALGEYHDYKSLLKKVAVDEHEAFAFVVKDYLEDYSVKARALLPILDEFIPTLEPLFLSKSTTLL